LYSRTVVTVYQVEVFTATPTVYMWAASKPATPAGAATYAWSNGSFGAAPGGWSLTIPTAPAGGNVVLWAATVDISDISDVSSSFNWNQAEVRNIGYAPTAAGAGPAGYSNARVFAYQRKASAPTGTPGAVDYDFTTGTITTATLLNGWQKTIPASDGNPLYVTSASASAAGSTDTIATGEWSGAVVLAYDGGAGTPGFNTATITLYQRTGSSTSPAKPSAAVTYTFATGAVAGLNNGWGTFIPTTGGAYLHTTFAVAIATTATDTIPATEWAAVQLMYDATDLVAAKAAADAANTAVADMSRDDLLSPVEKPAENLRWNAILGEKPGIEAAAIALGISTERNAYYSAYNALYSYVTGFGEAFTTIPGSAISIVGATYRTNFKNYYDAKQALLNAIAAKSATVAQWSGIGGAGKPADNASADLTLLSTGTVTVTGNRAVKASGSAAWDSSATSKESYVGGAFVSVRTDGAYDLMFGLNTDPATDSHWSSLDFAMELRVAGGVYAWESGTVRNGGNAIAAYSPGDMFAVIYDGSAVRYCKNGEVLLTTTLSAPVVAPLFFDSSLNTVGASLSNIRVGPMSSNSWGQIGGTGKPQDGATVGAPAGTLVAGIDAATIAAGAQAGNKLNSPPTVSGGSDVNSTFVNGGVRTITTRTANITGGEAPFQYTWVDTSGNAEFQLTGTDTATVTIRAGGFSETKTGVLSLMIKDALGRTAYDTVNLNVTFSG
jgi:hypothetical protein